MNALDRIDKRELKELLNKGWMTHDAMWLYHCYRECGVDAMNRVNLAAVKSMAAIEIKRVKKAIGMEERKIETFEDFLELFEGVFSIVKGDFMDFTFSAQPGNVIRWEWGREKCFAYRGVKGLGIIDKYTCGILRRIEGWFEALGIRYEMNPRIDTCIMQIDGSCSGEFKILL